MMVSVVIRCSPASRGRTLGQHPRMQFESKVFLVTVWAWHRPRHRQAAGGGRWPVCIVDTDRHAGVDAAREYGEHVMFMRGDVASDARCPARGVGVRAVGQAARRRDQQRGDLDRRWITMLHIRNTLSGSRRVRRHVASGSASIARPSNPEIAALLITPSSRLPHRTARRHRAPDIALACDIAPMTSRARRTRARRRRRHGDRCRRLHTRPPSFRQPLGDGAADATPTTGTRNTYFELHRGCCRASSAAASR